MGRKRIWELAQHFLDQTVPQAIPTNQTSSIATPHEALPKDVNKTDVSIEEEKCEQMADEHENTAASDKDQAIPK